MASKQPGVCNSYSELPVLSGQYVVRIFSVRMLLPHMAVTQLW